MSAVAERVWVDEHDVDFQSVSVLAWEPDPHRRLSLESWYIRTLKTFNREKGVLDNKYNCLFSFLDFSLTACCHLSLFFNLFYVYIYFKFILLIIPSYFI